MLKALIAVTCLAVLAAVGYYGWKEYTAAEQANQLAAFRRDRSVCLDFLARRSNDSNRALAEDCIRRGLLNLDDVNNAMR